MKLNQRLYDSFVVEAKDVTVDILSIGLGYMAVTTSDGGIGLAYTMSGAKTSCSVIKDDRDYEGGPALDLLKHILSDDPIHRGMALALVNALNHKRVVSLPADKNEAAMFDLLQVGSGTKVAMVGFFGPLVPMFEARQAQLTVIDSSREIGNREDFYDKLGNWAEVLVITSTSILNNTTEEILEHANPTVKTLMLGPSTPMVPQAFDHLPVRVLAGTVPLEKEKVLAAIRHGAGTPVIQRYSRKAYVACA